MRRRSIQLDTLTDRMIGLLYKARAGSDCPGDNYAYDLYLQVREMSRRAVRISRSRCFAAKRAGLISASDFDRSKFVQPDLF